VNFVSYLGSKQISVVGVKAADLVWQEKLLRRLTGDELAKMQFVCAPGSGGLITIVDEKHDGDQAAAVLLYKDAKPLDWSKR